MTGSLRWPLVALLVLGIAVAAGAVLRWLRVCAPSGEAVAGLYVDDTASDAAHLVMLAAMAVMIGATDAPQAVLTTTFTALAAVLVLLMVARVRAARTAAPPPLAGERAAGIGYHVVAALVMLWAAASLEDHHHAGMTMSGMSGASHGLPVPFGWVLGGFFALDAVGTAVIVARRSSGAALGVRVVPHVVMDVAMSALLLW